MNDVAHLDGERGIRFLAEASEALSSSLVTDEIVSTAVRLVIPSLADFAAIDLVAEDGSQHRGAMASARTGVEADLQRFACAPSDVAYAAVRSALQTGRAQPFDATSAGDAAAEKALGIVQGIALPLKTATRAMGVLTLAVGGARRFESTELWVAEGFARAAALALSNASTHEAVRQAERRADEARAMLDLIMQNAPLGIGVFDRSLRFARVNAALTRINGLPAEAHYGRTLQEVLPQLDASLEQDLRTVLATRVPITREISGQTAATGDEVHHWAASSYPLESADGEVFGVGAIIADITERRRGEDRLRFLAEASRLLSSSLEYERTLGTVARLVVPVLADWCTVDMLEDGQIRRIVVAHVDPAKVALAEELNRRMPTSLDAPQGVGAVLRSGKSDWMHEIPAETIEAVADPEQRRIIRELGLLSYMVVPLRARDATIGAITLVTAESGRRYGEEDLAFAEELARRASLAIENARLFGEAQQAIRAREDVLAFVSHDLKNPLTSIVMNATLLQRATPEGPTGDKLRRHTDLIVRAADRMNRLVNDLLDWASMRAGRLTLNVTEVPVAPMIAELTGILQPVAATKQQTLAIEVEEGLVMQADRDRIMRVLSNLIGNALKYTPERGDIRVEATRRDGEVVIAVHDTGPGITPDELPHVFDRYFRAKKAGTEGTGLGLAIAKGIVEGHGGRIWATSTVGVGSTFAFAIPTR
ncbi:MAG: PAS domain-containing protein [Deltaproteobacteria bacterium]|nr:PAS domain-containing protein [Deltaproteobacteria bacterium]